MPSVGIEQGAIGVELLVLDHQRQVVLAVAGRDLLNMLDQLPYCPCRGRLIVLPLSTLSKIK